MRKTCLASLAALTLLVGPASARAASITLDLDEFRSGQAPTSAAPWLTLTFADTGVGAVQLSVQSSLELQSEFITNIVFNIGGSINPTAVMFSENAAMKAGLFTSPAISRSLNGLSLPPASGFDFGLAFATSNSGGGVQRFNLADRLVYDLTCSVGADADCALFNATRFDATNNGGSWLAMTHYQGIPVGEGSGKFGATTTSTVTGTAVPEPTSLLLFGSGALGFLTARRRRKQQAELHA